jgi:uncharacterized DUF497 family protein
MIKVVWSEKKNRQNIRKHKVDFVEAGTIFDDPLQISSNDPDHFLTSNALSLSESPGEIVY